MGKKRIIAPEHFPWLDYKRFTFSMGAEKDGIIFLSGNTASEYDPKEGRVVVRGDIVEQTRLVYQKMGVVLEAAGASFDDVIKTVDYVDPRGLDAYRGTAEVRREVFKGNWPVSTGIVVERLLRPQAFIEIDALAVLNRKKEPVNPGWERYDRLTYHPAIRAGNLLVLSGITGHRGAGERGAGDPGTMAGAQTGAAYEAIGAILGQAGATPRDLVKTVDYITPQCVDHYGSCEEARSRFTGGAPPVPHPVVMNRLLAPEALIEVETLAVLGEEGTGHTPAGWSTDYRPDSPSAIQKGKFLFISGQAGIDHSTGSMVGEGDTAAQVKQAYDNIREIIETAGGSMADVVKTIEFITPQGLDTYRPVADIRRQAFQGEYPAATGVVVNSLTRPGLLIQVDVIAILD